MVVKTNVADFGGNWNNGSKVGAFNRNLNFPASNAANFVGSRLCFKKIAEN